MPQIRLRNKTGRIVLAGRLVRIHPQYKNSFLLADITDSGIIGTTAEKVSSGSYCLINLMNTVDWDDVINKPGDFSEGTPGDPGVDGSDGLSAYEIAVGQGFEGDVNAWLLSLKGDNGSPGTPGNDGYTPIKGVDYFDGDQGDKGDQGDPGLAGSDATVTKIAVETVLTGEISSHSHASSGGLSQQQIEGLI